MDFILTALDNEKISHIYVLTKDHREAIEEYLKTRKYSTKIEIFSFGVSLVLRRTV